MESSEDRTGRWVGVRAPARLHFGFLDLGSAVERRFGSLGLAVSGLDAVVEARPAVGLDVEGPYADKLTRIAQQVAAALARPCHLAVRIRALPPTHAGLGSGTLLALAAGTACAEALGCRLAPRDIAALTGRGQRSGIGIASFEQGGFLVDGGRAAGTQLPPLLARVAFPSDWRLVLLFDERQEGLSGTAERAAFQTLPDMPVAIAGELCRQVLMGVLPALHESDFAAFSAHLAEVQRLNGSYFAPAQGGLFASSLVGQQLASLARTFDLPGIGQSSWGPTGFIVTPDAATAQRVADACAMRAAAGLRCQIVAAANTGASPVAKGRDHGAKVPTAGGPAPGQGGFAIVR